VKESYGIHTILDFNEKSEVLLSTPKLIGEGVSKFWADIKRIKSKQR
jgi:hypothetical protein